MSFHPFIALCVGTILLTGCANGARHSCAPSATLRPINVFVRQPSLPDSLRRVAVLPMATRLPNQVGESGVGVLEPLLLQELRERQVFEVVEVSAAELKLWAGRVAVSAQEELPAGLLDRVRMATGCQAVILPELTRYQPYPPLVIGLSLRMVDCDTKRDWWAVDELVDAGEPAVAAAARAYARSELNLSAQNESSVLQSPRRFGSFVAGSLVSTVPGRAAQVY